MKKIVMCVLLGLSLVISCFAVDREKINAEIRKFLADKNATMLELIEEDGSKNYIKADLICRVRYYNDEDDSNDDEITFYFTNGDDDSFYLEDIVSIQYVAPVLTITGDL